VQGATAIEIQDILLYQKKKRHPVGNPNQEAFDANFSFPLSQNEDVVIDIHKLQLLYLKVRYCCSGNGFEVT